MRNSVNTAGLKCYTIFRRHLPMAKNRMAKHRNVPLEQYAAVASRAAVAAGSFLARHIGRPRRVETKRSAIDLVTEIDRASERLIHNILHRAYPECGFLGEEHGERRAQAPHRWIVDPLDGTNNFVHGFPMFGVSIGLECRGTIPPPGLGCRRQPISPAHAGFPGGWGDRPLGPKPGGGTILVGVIYDPMRRELFVAMRGCGSRLNGKRISVSPTRRLSHSLLSTGFSSNFLEHEQPYLGWFTALQRRSHGVRRIGSTVLSLAAVAAGRLEGFYERDLWPWDMAAGILLVQEAGGRVSNLEGRAVVLNEGRLVASNSHIHRELLRVLRRTHVSRVRVT
jgi:myo-inositol-1(or 4)-monophosphatase